MVIFNCLEPILIILLMLNSVFYPNFGTAVYFLFSLLLTSLCLNKDEKKIKMKQMLSIAIIGLSVAILITKAIVIVDLHKQGEIDLD
jgi:integral membrane sensor domain MASE1